jgi:hypothetical protein
MSFTQFNLNLVKYEPFQNFRKQIANSTSKEIHVDENLKRIGFDTGTLFTDYIMVKLLFIFIAILHAIYAVLTKSFISVPKKSELVKVPFDLYNKEWWIYKRDKLRIWIEEQFHIDVYLRILIMNYFFLYISCLIAF